MSSSEAKEDPPPPSAKSTSYSLLPKIPAPLQRLFDSVPLVTYPPNPLPSRTPEREGKEPILYVFTTYDEAVRGVPSFNPTCLKWQTYFKVKGVKFQTAPSSNHASPTGSLPYLQPLTDPKSTPSPTAAITFEPPIPSDQFFAYAKKHSWSARNETMKDRYKSTMSLLDTRIRPAWLHALYINPKNAPLLRRLYAWPVSSSSAVQASILYQLRCAARDEIRKAGMMGNNSWSGEDDEEAIYEGAKQAFEALDQAIQEQEDGEEGEWRPNFFQASVFAYTHLLLDTTLGWEDDKLGRIVRQFNGLVHHNEYIVKTYYYGCRREYNYGDGTWEMI